MSWVALDQNIRAATTQRDCIQEHPGESCNLRGCQSRQVKCIVCLALNIVIVLQVQLIQFKVKLMAFPQPQCFLLDDRDQVVVAETLDCTILGPGSHSMIWPVWVIYSYQYLHPSLYPYYSTTPHDYHLCPNLYYSWFRYDVESQLPIKSLFCPQPTRTPRPTQSGQLHGQILQ